jgi:hypothetical protein
MSIPHNLLILPLTHPTFIDFTILYTRSLFVLEPNREWDWAADAGVAGVGVIAVGIVVTVVTFFVGGGCGVVDVSVGSGWTRIQGGVRHSYLTHTMYLALKTLM